MEAIESEVTNSVEVENTTATDSLPKVKTDFVWTLQATWHLVRVRLEAEAEFHRSVCKKKRLWEGVAERVTARLRAEGYAGVPARAYECDLKWRNMLATYRKNAARARRVGLSGVHWEFFGVMDRVLGRSRQETEDRRKSESQNAELEKAVAGKRYTPILPTPALTATPAPAPSRPPQDILRLYLELQERKLNMWAQQKALEERKIDAINNLARAINSLAQDATATAGNPANAAATAGNPANAMAGNHAAATPRNPANAAAPDSLASPPTQH